MTTKHQKFDLDLSDYSPVEREAIALEVIDKIIKRTKSGKDKNGRAFEKYSKAYKESLAFKIAGKGSTPDLTLSGDMLDSIKILKNAPKTVIGFKNGSVENGKADGNIRGTYGKEKTVGPKREFLGISERELNSILSKYPKDSDRSVERAYKRILDEKAADKLSGRVKLQDLEIEDDN